MTQEEVQATAGPIRKTVKSFQTAWALRGYVPTVLYTLGSHILAGPVHPSWPLSVSLIVALSNKGSIRPPADPSKPPPDPMKAVPKLRAMITPEKWLPPLRSGFAVETSIPVRSLGLTGLLEEYDRKEDGSRTLLADWTIHNDVQRNVNNATTKVVLYLHGGGYTLLNRASHRPICVKMSKALNCRVLSLEYRLSPETVFPGALHDAVVAYKYLTDDCKAPAHNIIVSGDSAGGNLSLALLLYLRDEKMPRLGGGILLSPWCDLTTSLMSWETNVETDYLRAPPPSDPLNPVNCFLGSAERREKYVAHPYVTSCAAPFDDIPPLLIQAGGAEALRDDCTLTAQRAATAGVDVRLEIWLDGIHVAQGFPGQLGDAQFRSMEEWIARHAETNEHDPNVDFSDIDALLQAEYERRERQSSKADKAARMASESAQTGGNNLASSSSVGRRERAEYGWTFVATKKEAPAVDVRADAHPVVRAAVEENRKNRDKWMSKDMTFVYEAKALPRQGLLGNLKGLLHL